MKTKLKPSARPKKRYLLLEAKDRKEVEQVILDYIGILGWSRAAPLFVNSQEHRGMILAIERKSLSEVRAAFELSEKKIRVIKVSGTLEGLKR
jgi:RNase P/RNase MRP subunit POP5